MFLTLLTIAMKCRRNMSAEAAGYNRPDEGGETEEGTMTYWVYEDDPTNGGARPHGDMQPLQPWPGNQGIASSR